MSAEPARLGQRLRRLAAEEARYHALVESAPDAIVVVDLQGRITLVNRQTEVLFGYRREELLGQLLEILLPERFRTHHVAHRWNFAENPHTRPMGIGLELYALRKDGTEFPVEISLAPVPSSGEGEGASGISFSAAIRDVTARKEAELQLQQTADELRRSNAELEQFAYVASHDLQEPLRMVASYTQLLGRRYRGKLDADADEFIHYAVDGAQRMQNLINDLLAYSRVGTRGQPFERVDTATVLADVRRDLTGQIEDSGATLVVQPDLPAVWADPLQLHQLFQNLVANALKFHAPDRAPRVDVSATPADHAWEFAVHDNGIGIEPQYRERIFQLFQRLHSQAEYPGTGIGLAICRKIVERHGGRIWIDSEPGQGTTVRFTLPAEPHTTPPTRGGEGARAA